MFGWTAPLKRNQRKSASAVDPLPCDLRALPASGLIAGTFVASDRGWMPVEDLVVGDRVATFDTGMQKIAEIRRRPLWADGTNVPRAEWPLMVPAGVFDNVYDMLLLPQQGVMVESDHALEALGDPFVVLPAAELEGVQGITRQRPREITEVLELVCATPDLIYAEGGALVQCAGHRATLGVLPQEQLAFVTAQLAVEDPLSATGGRGLGQAA